MVVFSFFGDIGLEEGGSGAADTKKSWLKKQKKSKTLMNNDLFPILSLPQSPLATAPSSAGALGAAAPEGFLTATSVSVEISLY